MTNALTALEPIDDTTLNRAQYEAFEFELEAPGLMVVRNMSHETPSDHEYVVNVEDGVPVACECPSFEYRGGPCKHQVAIAIREPVLTAASDHDADPKATVATDGGQVELPEISVRREPEAVGGEKYLRCEGCGAEAIGTSERKLVHYEDCAHVEPGDPTR